MRKTKKLMAVALAATMVLGSGVTVFADETGSTTGTGSSEGHVEKEVTNVVLPTVAEGSSPFEYIMDPERLIQGTDAKKYADGTVFPDEDDDTGVYFLVGDKTYSNTSSTLQAINKSSCDIKLTVTVATTQGSDKDITLATSNQVSDTAAELYLELKVGSEAKAVSSTGAVSFEKVIAGNPDNFEVAVKKGSYVYQEKRSASDWKAMNISMSGVVSEYQIAADTTAPTVEVTWSWTKAGAGESASADAVDYSTAPAQSYAGQVVIPDGNGNATIAITIGKDKAAPVSVITDWFTGELLNSATAGWGVKYDAGSQTLTFESGISDALKEDPSHNFWVGFAPTDGGETYYQKISCIIQPEQSYAGEIVIPESGNITVAITIGKNNAVPTSITTEWFAGEILNSTTPDWGVKYDAESQTLIFDSGISDGIRADQTHTFTVTFTDEEGETYTQALAYSE